MQPSPFTSWNNVQLISRPGEKKRNSSWWQMATFSIGHSTPDDSDMLTWRVFSASLMFSLDSPTTSCFCFWNCSCVELPAPSAFDCNNHSTQTSECMSTCGPLWLCWQAHTSCFWSQLEQMKATSVQHFMNSLYMQSRCMVRHTRHDCWHC